MVKLADIAVTLTQARTFSFHCSACGKCCNSSPLLTLAELFRHQDRFIGCLSLRRVRISHPEARALAAALGHALPGGDFLMLAIQGVDYPSQARCPALGDDQLCTIHADRPSTCAVVPLDAWTPDSLQDAVLASRRSGADYIGADCITEGVREGSRELVRGGRIQDAGFAEALARRRADEAREKAEWGSSVFRLLLPELLAAPGGIGALPVQGYRTLALVPALAAVAAASEPGRLRCLALIDAQVTLIRRVVEAAITRKHIADRPVTATLRGFEAALLRFRQKIA
jgi:Fe-S-cluster containining protein